jgi:hypothetical protein
MWVEKSQMQPPGCKVRWNTNFLFIIVTEPILKNTLSNRKNRNYTLIIRMRYRFQHAKSVKPIRRFIDLQNYQNKMKLSEFFSAPYL